MASVTRSAGTGANGSGGGGTFWTDPGNITSSDNQYAAIPGPDGFSSQDLDCTNFGFTIPAGSTINGIEAHIERYGGGGTQDTSIVLLNGDGAGGESAQDKSAGATWGAETTVTFGGASDTWGESWTTSEVNSSNFGVRIQCGSPTFDFIPDQAYVDHVQITVHYTASGPNFETKAGTVTISDIKLGEVSIADIFFGTIDL
jgi:hypothetical protein